MDRQEQVELKNIYKSADLKKGDNMYIVHVHVHVKDEFIEEFKQVTIDNASNSVKEAGIDRFDVIQSIKDPTRFILVEVYKAEEATLSHKQTAHYARWRDAAEKMMVEPRTSTKFTNVYPGEGGWSSRS